MVNKTKITLLLILVSGFLVAQNGINYKAIIKDANGNVISNQDIDVIFTIETDGASVYSESQDIVTDSNGIAIAVIGVGSVIIGDFNSIDWKLSDAELNVQIDLGGGLVDLGNTPFNIVPYAIQALNVEGLETIDEGNGIGWRLANQNPIFHEDLGLNAMDLSISNTALVASGASGDYAVAMGLQSLASGNNSTAIGLNTIAAGDFAFASGVFANASGNRSIALGSFAIASGTHAISIGSATTADSDNAVAIGSSSTASGNGSVALGTNLTASGPNATAIGLGTNAVGAASTTMGFETTALGGASTAMGTNTEASGTSSIAMGTNTQSSGESTTAMGRETIASTFFSTAMGNFTNASGHTSTAMGSNTEASGDYATAMGRHTSATGQNALAVGFNTEASGLHSTAMGDSTTASGRNSVAFGEETIASGDNSLAFGYNTLASDNNSTALGLYTTASGTASLSLGRYTTASNTYAIAAGFSTTASGFSATSLGFSTRANSYVSTAIGRYNIGGGNPSNWVESDYLFVIGNGSSGNRSNALTVLKNGNIGIGTHTPQERLHITGGRLRIGTETIEDTGTNRLSFNADLLPDSDSTFRLGNSTTRWTSVWAVDGSINTSDRRDKENITDLNYGLTEIQNLKPVSFNWKERPEAGKKLGLIAQDLQLIIPEAVISEEIVYSEDDPGSFEKKPLDRLGVYYSDLIPVLIKAIQEQQNIIDNEKSINSKQSSQLEVLLSRIEDLEAKQSN